MDAWDGDGRWWHGETFAIHHGDQLQLPDQYNQYKADCDAKFSRWFRTTSSKYIEVANVEPGQPVMNGATREAIVIRTLVAAGDPAAMSHLVAAAERYGPGVLDQVGKVLPAAIKPQRLR